MSASKLSAVKAEAAPAAVSSPARDERRGDAGGAYLPAVVVIVAVAATFARVCGHEFVLWDDNLNVSSNPQLYGQSLAGLITFWRSAYAGLYAPMTYTVWWLLTGVAGVDSPDGIGAALNPYVFHTANLLLHVGSALFAYGLLKTLTGRRWPSVAGALLFALHPLQAEPVAWVTGLKDVLCGCFSLLALWQYAVYAKSNAPANGAAGLSEPARSRRHYAIATIAMAAALLSKPSAVTVPLLALIIDSLLVRRPVQRALWALTPWFVLAGIVAYIGHRAQPSLQLDAGPLLMRPLVAGHALAFYLRKLTIPFPLVAVYPEPIQQLLHDPWIWAAWIVPLTVLVATLVLRKRVPWLTPALVIFMVAPLPVLGFVGFDYESISTVADRYEYVGMIGPGIALAFFLARWHARRSIQVAWAICGAALLGWAVLSFVQCGYWADTRSLFGHNVAVFPNADIAYCNLAADALVDGDSERAVGLAQKAADLDPGRAQVHLTLGVTLEEQGRHEEAGREYLKAVDLEPTNLAAMAGLARELARVGQTTRALAIATFAVDHFRKDSRSHSCLSFVLLKEHRNSESLIEAQRAVAANPVDSRARVALAESLEANGRQSDAATQFAIALTLAPHNTEAMAGFKRTTQKPGS